MADIERMQRALVAADKAGDTEAATALAKAIRASSQPSMVDEAKTARDKRYGDGILGSVAKSIGAASDMVGSGLTFGFDDEINAGLSTGFGFLGDYGAAQKQFEARKQATREQNPVASVVGEIGGGVVGGGGASKLVRKLAQKTLPVIGGSIASRAAPALAKIGRTGANVLEGAALSSIYGAGEAGQGERLRGAAQGAVIGGLTSGVVSKAGDAIAGMVGRRAARQAVTNAPTAQTLKQAEDQLFNAARSSGVQVKPAAANRLVQNMRLAAGRPNDKIRPQTAGLIEDIVADPSKYTDIQGLHELRQEIGDLMGGAQSRDARTLGAMKRVLDGFIDNPNPNAFTGNPDGFKLVREGIQTAAKRFKTKEIENLLDLADVVAEGNVTQSGIAAALRTKAGQLYTKIVKGQVHGFSPEEIQMIRELASRNTSNKAIKWLAKWSPSGPMSTTLAASLGGGMGALLGGGPVGAAIGAGAIMVPGAVARGVADRGAIAAGNTLRASSALGGLPAAQAGVNRLSKYATPAAIAATQLTQPRLPGNAR
jgi:hypothetical protein